MYFVYILASRGNGTLYVGVTNDLVRRVYEHKSDFVDGFTKRYGVHWKDLYNELVWYFECWIPAFAGMTVR
jgi:predicted GIY-YIG superfamily endonuclease